MKDSWNRRIFFLLNLDICRLISLLYQQQAKRGAEEDPRGMSFYLDCMLKLFMFLLQLFSFL